MLASLVDLVGAITTFIDQNRNTIGFVASLAAGMGLLLFAFAAWYLGDLLGVAHSANTYERLTKAAVALIPMIVPVLYLVGYVGFCGQTGFGHRKAARFPPSMAAVVICVAAATVLRTRRGKD